MKYFVGQIHIERYGRTEAFRIDTGRTNDDYQHGLLQTFEEFEYQQERNGLVEKMNTLGLALTRYGVYSDITNNKLERVIQILEEA